MSTVLPSLRAHAPLVGALLLLTAGGAYGVVGQGGDQERSGPAQVRACVDERTKVLTKTTATRSCPEGSREISWNIVGRRGAAGPAGVAGQPGGVGAAGAAGAKGAVGADGTAGPTGAPGSVGAPGPTGPAGPTGPRGVAGTDGTDGADAVSEYAQFYALSPPNNPATVGAGEPVSFPQDGPTSGAIVRAGSSSFVLPAGGTYRVSFSVPVNEQGQLVVVIDGVELGYTVVGRNTGSTAIGGESLIETGGAGSVLEIQNPLGNSPALTVTQMAGGTRPAASTLIIEQLD